MRSNLAPGCISSNVKLCQRKPLFLSGTPFFGTLFLGPLVSLVMQPGAKLQAYLGSLFCSLTPARSVLDFESFAGRGQMLDGRVLGASQVEYKPFGKLPLKREVCLRLGGRAAGKEELSARGQVVGAHDVSRVRRQGQG